MSIDTSVLESDYKNVIADLPSTLVFGPDTVSVAKGERDREDSLEMVGFNAETDLEVMCVISEFTTVPTVGSPVTVDGKDFKVERAQNSMDDKAVHLFLMET